MEEDGRSIAVINDVVQSVSEKRLLPQTPDGWQEILIGFERDTSKHGIHANFTLPLGFVGDGARILRDRFYRNNIENKVYLLIQRYTDELTSTHYKEVHKYFYKGELDFSTFKDEDHKVTINVSESGFRKLLKAGERTMQEISLDDPEYIPVKIDGTYLHETHNMVMLEYLRNVIKT